MSRRHELLREVQEAIERQRELRKKRAYDPAKMDCEKMPLGCWLWIAALVVSVLLFLGWIRL